MNSQKVSGLFYLSSITMGKGLLKIFPKANWNHGGVISWSVNQN